MVQFDKFEVPDAGIGLVPRQDLESRVFESIARKKLTYVVAPAGSGKSMLLARLHRTADTHGFVPVWFGCEEADLDGPHFLSQIDLALGTLRPAGAAPNRSRGPRSVETILQKAKAIGRPVLLSLDNFHLCDGQETGDHVRDLVKQSQGSLQIVVSSRHLPRIDVASLRMQGQVGEFSATDLAFTSEEAGRFVSLRPGRLTDERVQNLIRRTEGWAAALQIIRLLVLDGADIDRIASDFSGADDNVRDFLYEEVFRSLPVGTREFLVSIAHLDRICADLAVAVTENSDAVVQFEDIIERNLFVLPLDRKRQWIRLHSVFRDFLVAQAAREPPDIARQRLQLAANWHWNNGFALPAITYALEAADPRQAVAWLRECANEVIVNRGELVAFRACCERLSVELEEETDIVIWMVWAAAFSLSWSEASMLHAKYVANLEASAHASQRALLLRTLLTYFSHDFKTAIELGQRWMTRADVASTFDRATIAAVMAMSLRTCLQKTQALAWLDRARHDVAQTNSTYGQAWVSTISAFFSLIEGRPIAARDELERLLAGEPADSLIRGTAEPILAEAYYELDQLDEAREVVRRSFPTLMQHGALDIALAGWKTAAFLTLYDSGPNAALRLLDEAEDAALRRYGQRGSLLLRTLKVQIAQRLSDEIRRDVQARGIGEQALPAESSDWCLEFVELRTMLKARQHLLDGRPRQAISTLNPVLVASRSEARLGMWIEASCIKAAAEYADGNTKKGERTLIDCISRAAPLGMCRSFLDQENLLRAFGPALLKYRSRAGSVLTPEVNALISNLLRIMRVGEVAQEDADYQQPVESLTPQEVKVLALLSEGFANKDIADHMILAMPTVKWHIYNIFRKLDVRSRTAAVRKGWLLGFLA